MILYKEVALYLRKSRFDDESETQEQVLARHEKLLTDYCKRNNLIIRKIYREVVSGENIENRPQCQQLLEDVANGLYDGVVVVEIERLSRGNPIDQFEILETFKGAKAKIYTLQKVYDFSTENDIDEEYFEFGLFMSRREYKTIKKRLMRGKKQAQQEGYFIGSYLPFGYDKKRIDKGNVLIPNEKAEIVKLIFNKYVYEDYNISNIHEYLFKNKIKSSTGNENWSTSSILKILKNKTYLGYIATNTKPNRDKAIWVKGRHEAIIDADTFEKAQIKIKENDPKITRALTIQNPLAGLVYCPKCGHIMSRSVKHRNRPNEKELLSCRTRHCTNSGTYLEIVEEAIINELKKELAGFNYFIENYGVEAEKNKITKQKELELINKEILKKETMINRCCELLEQGVYTIDKYNQRVNILENDLVTLKNNLIEVENNIQDDKKDNIKNAIPILEKVIDEYWNLTTENKNKLLKSIIERIEYKKDKPNKCYDALNDVEKKIQLKIFMKI